MADDALAVLAALVLDNGRRWGEVAESWQRDDARAVLEPEGDRRYHFLTRPRGGSKTADLAGVAIVALLVQAPPRARCYGLAADRDQGALLVDSIGGFVERTPELGGTLRVEAARVVNPADGGVAGGAAGGRSQRVGAAAVAGDRR